MKLQKASLLVGDRVRFCPGTKENGVSAGEAARGCREGLIEALLPRGNCLTRPPVANVEQLVLVLALRDPDPDWQLASRLLLMAERERMEALLCLNKVDLVGPAEIDAAARFLDHFPYPYLFTSAKAGKGIAGLEARLRGCHSVFAGPSGAGKSTLLNAVEPGLVLKTGAISAKAGRGRHTTRLAELLPLPQGGMVVDTPGFSRVDFAGLEPEQLERLFPELDPYRGRCSFRNCTHLPEPGCAVRDAAAAGEINPWRYQHYRCFLQELIDRRKDQR
jgi:ribosome biogenesis GTPase